MRAVIRTMRRIRTFKPAASRADRDRRGMTLVEVLLSVSLLSAILIAALAWTRTSAVLTARASGSLRWEVAAESVLRRIGDELD